MKFQWCILLLLPPWSLAFTPLLGRPVGGSSRNANTKNLNNNKKQHKTAETTSRRSYANLADPPTDKPTTTTHESFESRMRKMVLSSNPPAPFKKASSATSTSSSSSSSSHTIVERPAVHRVSDLADYKRTVTQEKEKLTVVRFFADYCRSCHAMSPAFYRLAQRNNDNVQWAEVPVTSETTKIHQGLQVPSVPFGHIYHPEAGLVEELRLRKKFLASFSQILKSYQEGQCELPSEVDPETGMYEAPYVRHHH